MKLIVKGKPNTGPEPTVHKWFAWFPVWARNEHKDFSYVWLEHVLRKENEDTMLCNYTYWTI